MDKASLLPPRANPPLSCLPRTSPPPPLSVSVSRPPSFALPLSGPHSTGFPNGTPSPAQALAPPAAPAPCFPFPARLLERLPFTVSAAHPPFSAQRTPVWLLRPQMALHTDDQGLPHLQMQVSSPCWYFVHFPAAAAARLPLAAPAHCMAARLSLPSCLVAALLVLLCPLRPLSP